MIRSRDVHAGARVLLRGAPATVIAVVPHKDDPADDDVHVRLDDGLTTTVFAFQLERMPLGRCLECRLLVENPERRGSGTYCAAHAPASPVPSVVARAIAGLLVLALLAGCGRDEPAPSKGFLWPKRPAGEVPPSLPEPAPCLEDAPREEPAGMEPVPGRDLIRPHKGFFFGNESR